MQSPASDFFAIGSYHLSVQPDQVPTLGTLLRPGMHGHTGPASASTLASAVTVTGVRQVYHYRASLSDPTDVYFYQVSAPSNPNGTHDVLTVSVRAVENAGFDPVVAVYNGTVQPVKARTLTHANGTYTVQVPDAAPGAVYYIAVQASNPSVANNYGNFAISIDFRSPAVRMIVLDTGVLQDAPGDNSANPASHADLELDLTQQMAIQFVLSVWQDPSATAAPVTADQAIQFTITDSAGNVLATMTAQAGQTQSITLLLSAGTYYIHLVNLEHNTTEPALDFELDAIIQTDPIGTVGQSGSGYTVSQSTTRL